MRRADDDTDRRRKMVRITPRGLEALALSAVIFDDIRARWAGALGPDRLSALKPTCAPWPPARRSASTCRAGSARSPIPSVALGWSTGR